MKKHSLLHLRHWKAINMKSRLISHGDLSLAKEIDTDIRARIAKRVIFQVFNNQYAKGATNCNRNTALVVGLLEMLEQLRGKSALRRLMSVFLPTGVEVLYYFKSWYGSSSE